MGKLTGLAICSWIKADERFEGRSDGDGLYLRYRKADAVPRWLFRYRFAGEQRVINQRRPMAAGQVHRIYDARLLLDDPDKVEPLVNRAADALRAAVSKTFGAYRSEYDQCAKEIEAAPEWAKLAPEARASILREARLSTPADTLKLGTLTELTASRAACSPQRWIEKRDALRGQITRALNLAAKKLAPTVPPVTPPRRILRSEAAFDAWGVEVRKTVLAKLAEGPVRF